MLNILLLVGIILAIGYVVGRVTHALRLTGVVGYIIVGIILGPVIGIAGKLGISEGVFSTFWGIATDFTLALIAFIIGSQLTFRLLRKLGKPITMMLFGGCIGTFFIVTLGTYIYAHDLVKALILGSLAPATAPAATVAVLHEYRAKGPLSNSLLALVGWDDAITVIIFVIALAAVKIMLGGGTSISSTIATPVLEIFGGLALGAAIGGILAFVVKKVREREAILVMSLAAILIGAGFAEFLNLSLILTCMAIGIVFINLLPAMGSTPRGLIEGIMPPIYVIFFALAGMQFRFDLLRVAGLSTVIYIICRAGGKIGGTSLGATLSGAPTLFRKYLGFGMLPQAGVAMGLAALLTTELAAFSEGGELAALGITIALATTIVFEIIGPIGVRYAITRAGEARRK